MSAKIRSLALGTQHGKQAQSCPKGKQQTFDSLASFHLDTAQDADCPKHSGGKTNGVMKLTSNNNIDGIPQTASQQDKQPAESAAENFTQEMNDNFMAVARAMMTTDTVEKIAFRKVEVNGREVRLLGLAKGAGMIMPNMATMLCFVVTDAAVSADLLGRMLKKGVDQSFNVITVDGDTSTNDTVLVMANGLAENSLLTGMDQDGAGVFQKALDGLLKDLALQIVADGEGATKLITVRVNGASNRAAAEQAARTVANSALFKTACFGEDANWGRIIGALGRSGVDFDPERVDIGFDDVLMVREGLGLKENEEQATSVLKQKEFTVTIDLKNGSASSEIYTCDFSLDYVRINADYRT